MNDDRTRRVRSDMADEKDKDAKKRKGFAPRKKRNGGNGKPDKPDGDDSVDSKGNIRGLIDYDFVSEDSSDSSYKPPKRSKKVRNQTVQKPSRVKRKEPEPETDSEDEMDELIQEYLAKREKLAKREAQKSKKSKARKEETESESESEESEEYESEESEESEEEEDSEEESDEESESHGGTGDIIFTFGGDDSAERMIPKRHNLKKESSEVKKFVKLLTTQPDEDTIDGQIDQFKALAEDQRTKLLSVLEARMKTPTSMNPQQGLMFKILTMNLPAETQQMVFGKYNALQMLDPGSSEYFKMRNWLEKVTSLPLGLYKELPVKIADGTESCGAFMERARKCLDEAIYGQDEAKLQILQFIGTKIANPSGKGLSLLLAGPPGIGKCHAKDTPILMANGSIKRVQDIQVGEFIMGDDSTPRKVLSLGRGKDTLYKIIPTKGDTYTVNSEHILCLKQSGRGQIKKVKHVDSSIVYKAIRINNKTKSFTYKSFPTEKEASDYLNTFTEEDNIVEISVKDYLNLSNEMKHWLKAYKKGVTFPYTPPEFDPYIIGLWLGDGAQHTSVISNQDSAVLHYLNKTLPTYNLTLKYYSQYDYRIKSNSTGKKDNTLLMTLKKYNMINDKHIPDHFKINSREVRLQVLAGLIDSDGSIIPETKTYEIIQVSDKLTNDILFLARSLGFAAYSYKKNTTWMYKDIKKTSLANCITISGHINEIPVKIFRKKCEPRLQKKDVLVTGIQVKDIGFGDYYGFTLDGNHRYLMGDFTVTHNTSLIKNGIAKALQWPFQFISLGGDSDASTYTGHQLVYESSHCGKIVNSLCAAKSMTLVLLFDELDKISTTPKGEEVQNLLVHLTDSTQNMEFEDKYLAGIPIDLSRIMFAFSANYLERIDRVLLDRMTVVNLKGYSAKEKAAIAENYLLPIALKEVDLVEKVSFGKDVMMHIIETYANEETGVRELKRCIEQVAQKLNMLRMFNTKDLPFHIKDFSLPFHLKTEHVDLFLRRSKDKDESFKHMYI